MSEGGSNLFKRYFLVIFLLLSLLLASCNIINIDEQTVDITQSVIDETAENNEETETSKETSQTAVETTLAITQGTTLSDERIMETIQGRSMFLLNEDDILNKSLQEFEDESIVINGVYETSEADNSHGEKVVFFDIGMDSLKNLESKLGKLMELTEFLSDKILTYDKVKFDIDDKIIITFKNLTYFKFWYKTRDINDIYSLADVEIMPGYDEYLISRELSYSQNDIVNKVKDTLGFAKGEDSKYSNSLILEPYIVDEYDVWCRVDVYNSGSAGEIEPYVNCFSKLKINMNTGVICDISLQQECIVYKTSDEIKNAINEKIILSEDQNILNKMGNIRLSPDDTTIYLTLKDTPKKKIVKVNGHSLTGTGQVLITLEKNPQGKWIVTNCEELKEGTAPSLESATARVNNEDELRQALYDPAIDTVIIAKKELSLNEELVIENISYKNVLFPEETYACVTGNISFKNCLNIGIRRIQFTNTSITIENSRDITFNRCNFIGKLVLNSCDDVTLSIANFIYEEADSGLNFSNVNNLQIENCKFELYNHSLDVRNLLTFKTCNSVVFENNKFYYQACSKTIVTKDTKIEYLGNELITDVNLDLCRVYADINADGEKESIEYDNFGFLSVYQDSSMGKMIAQTYIPNNYPYISAVDIDRNGINDIYVNPEKSFTFHGNNLFPLALPDEGIYITEEESYEEDLNGDGFNEEIKFVYSKDLSSISETRHGTPDNISSGDCWLEILDGTNENVCRLKLAEEHYLKNYITPDIIFFDVNHNGIKDLIIDNTKILCWDGKAGEITESSLPDSDGINPQFETARSDRVFEVTIDKTDKLSIEIPEHLYQSNSEINADFIASNKVYINRELIGSEYLFVLRNIGFAQNIMVYYQWDEINQKWIYEKSELMEEIIFNNNPEFFDHDVYVTKPSTIVNQSLDPLNRIEFYSNEGMTQLYVSISSDNVEIKNGLKIGDSKSEVAKVMGLPPGGSYFRTLWCYKSPLGPNMCYLSFIFKNDILYAIEYACERIAPWD